MIIILLIGFAVGALFGGAFVVLALRILWQGGESRWVQSFLDGNNDPKNKI